MNRKIILATLVAGALIAAGAAYGIVAHTTAESQTIAACVAPDGGMRLAGAAGDCKKNETVLTWNTVGPAGADGLPGAPGLNGQNGQNGQNGRDATAIDPNAVAATLTVNEGTTTVVDGAALSAVSHEVVSPRDLTSGGGGATGKTEHKPFVVTMQWNASTISLIGAEVSNRNLSSVLIGLSRNGTQFATIKLTNAAISDYQQHGDTASFTFVYQKIEWTAADGTTTQDDLNK